MRAGCVNQAHSAEARREAVDLAVGDLRKSLTQSADAGVQQVGARTGVPKLWFYDLEIEV